MKRLIIFLFFLANIFVTFAQSSIDKEHAWEMVRHEVLNDNVDSKNVSVSFEVIPSHIEIKSIITNVFSPDYDSWFFFIDDKPFASWEHSCRYVFVDIATGKIEILNRNMPPLIEMEQLVAYKIKTNDLELLESLQNGFSKYSATTLPAVNDYAVIISGGMTKNHNYERYWNDCAIIYNALVNVYKYPKSHIYVLMSDGTSSDEDRYMNNGNYTSSPLDLDGDGVADIGYSATCKNITKVFDELSKKITDNDNLFIFSTDHGGSISNTQTAYMCLWNGEYLYDSDFAKEVNKVKAKTINICMEQCFSGGFIDDLQGSNRVIATACDYNETSFATNNLLYDEFVYYWVSAVAKRFPNGNSVDADLNRDGRISMYEAFIFAQKNDKKNETPQFYSSTDELGNNLFLYQSICEIVGDIILCDSAVYHLANLPKDTKVQWELLSTKGGCIFKQDTPTHNKFFIKKVNGVPFSGVITANIYDGNDLLASINKKVSAKGAFSGTYEQESGLVNNVYHPAIEASSLKEGTAMFVHQGCNVILRSKYGFDLMYISHSGITPSSWYYNGEDQITFVLPTGSGGIPFHVTGKGKGGSCGDFDLLFFSVANNGNIVSLKVQVLGATYRISFDNLDNISLQDAKNDIDGLRWKLELYDMFVGNKIFETEVGSAYYDIDTSKLKKGNYIIRAVHGNNVLAKKIVIY